MALSYVGSATSTYGITSVTPSNPSGYTATNGDLALILVVSKRSATATPNTPSGWWRWDTEEVGTGTPGAGTGPLRLTIFYQTIQGNFSWPAITQTSHTGAVISAEPLVYRATTGTYSMKSDQVSDTSSGTAFGGTIGSNPGFTTGDHVAILSGLTSSTPSFTAFSISATGATFSALTERVDGFTSNGDDLGIGLHTGSVTAGTATAAAVTNFTLSSGTTGGQIVLRVREDTSTVAVDTLSETFDSGWGNLSYLYGTTANTGGEAVVTANADGSWSGVETPIGDRYSFANSSIFAEITPASLSGGTWAQTSLTLYRPEYLSYVRAYIYAQASGTTVGLTQLAPGQTTYNQTITYNATSHRWLRLREASGTTYLDVSPDGVTWSASGLSTSTFSQISTAKDMWVSLEAARSGGSASTATFDNINVAGAADDTNRGRQFPFLT